MTDEFVADVEKHLFDLDRTLNDDKAESLQICKREFETEEV